MGRQPTADAAGLARQPARRCRMRRSNRIRSGATCARHPRRLSGDVPARLASALDREPFVERLVHFWANHFAVSVDKLPVIGLAGLLEFEAIRPHVLGTLRRHAARGRAASGDAALSRPGPVDRPELAAPASFAGDARRPAARPQRESRARDHGAAHARRAQRLHPGRRHRIRAGPDRLDGGRPRPRAGRSACIGGDGRPATSTSPRRSTSRARRTIMGRAMRRHGRGAGACGACTTSPPIRRPRAISRPSSPATSPATIRRRRWSSG